MNRSVEPAAGASPAPEESADQVDPPVLSAPADGVPDVVTDDRALAETAAALRAGTGPIAVDAERAQGYRYGSEAYLIQLRRAGSGTHLVDPRAFLRGDRVELSVLAEAMAGTEWIIHAASQDLPCLADAGLLPDRLFDTELAGRLLNRRRVGLGPLIEEEFGLRLLKEHSAADWSRRPMPPEWLTYAALDVELLVELRERMAAALVAAGKDGWAAQEFAALAADAGSVRPPRQDPWRRTSGIHAVRNPAGLAVVRELWTARDELAQRLDRAPGRLLQDAAITELATQKDPDVSSMTRIAGFKRRAAQQHRDVWVAALQRATGLARAELPPMHLPSDAPPPPRTWANRDPLAAARWDRVRPAVVALAETHDLPTENLLSPDLVRRLAWRPPAPRDTAACEAFLVDGGARRWQRELVLPVVVPLLDDSLSAPDVHERARSTGRRRRPARDT